MHTQNRAAIRRIAALVSGLTLVCAIGATSLAAARSSFTGDFDLVTEGSRDVVGHINAATFVPTSQRLVPGSYDFKGSPVNATRETHAQISTVQYWFDANNPAPGLGGSNVAFAEGAACDYTGPGDAGCHPWAVMFIDDLDPSLPDQVAYADERDAATGEWNFDQWYWVGRGEFVLRFVGS